MTENDVSFFEACLSFAAPEVKVNPSDKRIFDGSKVEDHHTLVCDRPTEAFSPEERNIYNIVAASMRQATGQPALIELRRKQRAGVGRSLQVNNTRTLVQNRIKDLETLLKIRQKNKTLIGYRMKFLFWLEKSTKPISMRRPKRSPDKSIRRGNGGNRNWALSVTRVYGLPEILFPRIL